MNLKNKILSNQGYLVIGIIVIVSVIGFYRTYIVEKDGVYTIATVYDVTGARGGLRIFYKYSFSGKMYDGYAVSSEYKMSDNGCRYFIKFLKKDPSRCIITNISVPSYIEEAPSDGWEELPVPHD